MSFELACCLLATAAALFYIFFPGSFYVGPEKTRASFLRERKDAVYENLRDLNFEFKAGKMPDPAVYGFDSPASASGLRKDKDTSQIKIASGPRA